jgi:hypothetical protein
MGGGLTALGAEAIQRALPVAESLTQPVKEFGLETIESAQKKEERYQGAVPSWRNISGVQDALYYLSHGIGTLLPMIGMSMVSGGIGAAAGKALAKNYVSTLATRLATGGASKEAINVAIQQGLLRGLEKGALLGGYASSLAMEAGSITADMARDQKDIDPLRVMMGAVPAAALDVLPEFSLIKRTGLLKRLGLSKAEADLAEEAARKVPGSFLGRVGKEAGKQFMMEAPTEAMQSVLERWSEGKDLTSSESIDDYIDSFLIGGAGGALFGGLGGAFEKPGQVEPTHPVTPSTVPGPMAISTVLPTPTPEVAPTPVPLGEPSPVPPSPAPPQPGIPPTPGLVMPPETPQGTPGPENVPAPGETLPPTPPLGTYP